MLKSTLPRPIRRSRRPAARVREAISEMLDRRVLLASNISIAGQSLLEGDSGQLLMNFTVSRSGDLSSDVTVSYATADGTATAGVDYVAQSGNLTIPSGQASAVISVPIIGDVLDELDETFFVNLTGVVSVSGGTTQFAARQDFPMNSGPLTLASADFNGDGQDDVAAANFTGSTVSVRLNQTTPGAATSSFGSIFPFTAGTSPRGIAAADFNLDGKPDLAAANNGSNNFSILLNNAVTGSPAPSFLAAQNFTTGAGTAPAAIVVGDFNLDGRPDLAIGKGGANNVGMFHNTTTPGSSTITFAGGVDFPVLSIVAHNGLAVADLNRDGRPDLVASKGSTTNGVTVLVNATSPGGVPSFGAAQHFAAGNDAQGVAVGDVNGDGRIDIAVSTAGASGVSVLLNQTAAGSATISLSTAQPFITNLAPRAVGLLDVNGDGRLDLVTADSDAETVSVRRNTTPTGAATASFAINQHLSVSADPEGLAFADLNRDGRADLIAANSSSSSISVFLNQTIIGASTVVPAFPSAAFTTGSLPHTAAFGDINSDGRADLVAINQNSFSVSVLLNATAPGAPTASYAAKQDFAVQSFPDWVEIADLNNDGRLDLMVSNGFSDSISVLLNTTTAGSSTVTFAPRQDFTVGSLPRSVVAVDLNSDGRLDLVSANLNADTISVFFNNTTPGAGVVALAARQDIAAGDGPTAITVADFNLDGRRDLAVANFNAGAAAVFLNSMVSGATTASFAPRQDFPVNSGPRGIASADVNNDGKPDVIVANAAAGEIGTTVSTLLNATVAGSSVPAFAAKQDTTVGTGPISIAAGDLNGDGRADFSVANFGSNNVTVMLNQTATNSTTTSYLTQNFAAGTNPIFSAIRDVNGDGRAEFSSANFGSDSASVFLNTPFVITQNLGIGTILDNDPSPRASFSPITSSPLGVRWEPVLITPQAIADDPSLADKRTFDLIVTTTTDWISAGVQVTLPTGATFYNHPLGGNTAPHPAVVATNPALAFDTFVNGPGGLTDPPFVLGGFPTAPQPSFGPTVFSVAWGDLIVSPGGAYQIARLTFSMSALSGNDLVLDSSRTSQIDPQTVETIIPVPEIFQSRTVEENAGTIALPVFLGGISAAGITVSASVVGGTATPSNDFFGPNPVVITPGASSGNLELSIVNDQATEPDETIELRLNNPADSSASGTLIQYIKILDNDPPPVVQFASPTLNVGENVVTANISVTLSHTSVEDVLVPYSVTGGTAVSPDDYSIPAEPLLTIPAGSLSGSIPVSVVNDALDEDNETVILQLGTPTNGVLGSPISHTLTILDDDPLPIVRFKLSSASAGEETGELVVDLELSAASGRDVTVPLSLGAGTASTPGDFTFSPATVVIPAGSLDSATTITLVNDATVDPNETVILNLGTPTNATVGTPSQFTLTIVDDDVPPSVVQSQFFYQTAPHRLTFQFSVDVSASLAAGDLVLQNLTAGTIVLPASMNVIYNPATNTATFTFPGAQQGVLADGNYRARLPAAGISDAAGNTLAADHVFDFFQFTGDANHDRIVDIGDFAALAANFNRPGDFTQGDFDYTGVTDLSDFSLLAIRFNRTLPPPAPPLATAPRQPAPPAVLSLRPAKSVFASNLIGRLDDLLA